MSDTNPTSPVAAPVANPPTDPPAADEPAPTASPPDDGADEPTEAPPTASPPAADEPTVPKTDPPVDGGDASPTDAPAPDDTPAPDDSPGPDDSTPTAPDPTPAPTTIEATDEPEPTGEAPTDPPVASPTDAPPTAPEPTPSLGGGGPTEDNMTPQPTPAIYQPDRDSLAPHKDNIADTIGQLEKSELDKLNGAEIFGITVGVLAFICILGFCFGRKCARWCMKRELRHSDKNERAPFPLNDSDQELL